jgi:hypothetical protein
MLGERATTVPVRVLARMKRFVEPPRVVPTE